ncbi:MAG: 30S ribosomal protein S9 [Bacteroidetes bacterium]|nr:30S ribosomal protein S9 [Bacteroidota bacterium]
MEQIATSGRRKTSVARAFLSKGKGDITINGRDYKEYFATSTLQFYAEQSLLAANVRNEYNVKVNVQGGGTTGQAQATRLAIAKALVEENPEFRAMMKPDSLLTRDSRMVERKKFGRAGARRRFQFSKR